MKVELLKVEDVFGITGQGLLCAPLFPVPRSGRFTEFSAVVTVQAPRGPAFDVDASFHLTHFKTVDARVPIEKRWQVVTCLGKIPKESVPPGSVIFCDGNVKARLLPSA